MLGGAQLARAQVTYYWRGDSAEADGRNWQVNNNWWRGYTEAPAGSEIIIFDNNHKTEQNTNNLSATSRYRLLFNSGASNARTITGTTENVFYDFGGNVPKIENNDTGTKTLAFPIGVGYNNTEINPVSGSLTLDRLDLQGNNVNVYGNNGHTLRIRGQLRGSGSGTIAIQQNSTVVIAGTATNMGTMTINAGVLQYEATTGAGHTNTINVGDTSGSAAARLAIGAADVTVSNRISVRSGSSGQKTIANVSSGSATFSGAVTLNTSLTISNGSGGSLLFSGPVDFNGAQRFITLPTAHTSTMSAALSNDGGNGLVKQGGGELILGASNNIVGLYIDAGAIRYTGTVAHVRGVIDIGPGSGSGDARLILATGGLTVTNRIESKNTTGTRNLDAVNTSGTITLSGSNLLSKELTYDVASGGTLDVTGIVAGGGVLNKIGSGTMILSGNNLFTGNSIVSGGVLRISHANALGTTAGSNIVVAGATLEVTGGITVGDAMSVGGYGVSSNGVIRNVSGNNTLSGGIQATSVVAIGVAGASDNLTLSGVISAPSATNNIIKNGAGVLTLSGNNTFTSQLDIQGGVLSVNSINSSASAAQPLGSRTTSPAIRLGSTDSVGTSRGTLRYTGASDATLPKTIRLTEGTEGGLDITNNVTVTANGVISVGSTAAWLIKSGIGRVTLDAINTYEGRTVITQGVLRVLNSSSLGNTNDSDNQATYVWPGTGMEAALEISGGTSLRERIYLAGEGVSSGGALRNISGDNTLTGRVFFSAATRISSDAGTLNLSNSTAITSAFGLTLAGAGDVVWNTPLNTGANTLTKDGAGTATIHSTNTYSGATTVSNGTLVMRGSSASSAHTVMGGATLRGAGTVGALSIFGTVDPGNATGDRATLTSGNLTLQTNGAMRVDISNVSGTPGTDWDQINAGSGSITVNATTTDRFTIQLNGNPTGWDNTATYSWRIVAAGSVSGFDTNKFTVNTSGFTPSLGGGMFSVTNSGGNLFLAFFPGTAGDIDVRGNGVIIAPGDTTPSLADHTLFGDVLTSGGTQQRVYTITNSGTAAIGLGNISFSGGNSGDFTVINQPPGSLPAGGSTNITIEFDPGADGERWTDLTFTNTVAAKSPYTFRIAGTGVTYNLDVRGNGVIIADGDTTPSTADHTDFGSVGVAGDTLTRTYTITNSGNRDLSVSNVFIIGTHASDFTVTAQPSATVAPGATTTFQVQFDPSAVGLRTAEIVFTNTSTTGKNPYNFAIQGTGAGSGITNSPLSLSFSSTLGSLPSPSFQTFGVTNVGLGTLTYSLSTNASWLFLTGSGSTAAAGAGNTHTANVQMVGVMAAGTSNATITITGDSATTNSPKTISVTWTINAIADPSAAAASPEGAEFVRLSWTKHASHDVLITYNRSNAPPAPANGTSYNAGDSVGSGAIVLYKGAASGFEHVVPRGSTNFYSFYSINNNYYSPGLTRGATADVYKVYEIVEPFSYTNALTLNGRTNQGWAAAGTWTNTGNAYVIVSNLAFTAISGYPTAAGNIITGQSATAFRVLPQAYSSGKVYIGFMFRASGVGATEYSGLSVFNGGTEEVFIGERFATTAQLGLEVPGGSTASGPQLSANTDYTIIARYDLDADTIDAVIYTNSSQSVPAVEPATWHLSITDSSPPAQVDRIRLEGNVGLRWDEIRIATNWVNLLRRDATFPFVTNLTVNGGSDVTDAQMTGGTFSVVAHLRDEYGIETTNTTSPFFIPNFDILSNDGSPVQLITDRVFQTFGRLDSGKTVIATSASHSVIAPAEVTLGVHTVRVSVANSNGLTTIDVRTNSAGATLSFTVVDDDTAAPTFGTFIGQGRDIAGAVYTNTEFTGGFWVTGTVTDAGSGLFASSNTFTLSRNGSVISSGTFAVNFSDGGATAGGRVSNNFAQADMIAGAYTLTVFAVDFDVDRPNDSLRATNVFSFSVVEPPAAPGLIVGPLTLTYNAILGSTPAAQTFAVTNVGIGTLNYTNYQTYGTGPSGWFAANPTNNSLGAGASRIHTGHVAFAGVTNIGAFIATNRVDGNQTNSAALIVVTLNVSNIPNPTAQSATADGAELVRLAWTKDAAYDVLIVHRSSNAPAAPVNGTAYNPGDSLGGGATVIYKGSAASLEHVVRPSSTNHYAFYSINNNYYSPGVSAVATNPAYPPRVIIEQFAYTNGLSVSGLNGGQFWTNAWDLSSGAFTIFTNQFEQTAGYPNKAANTLIGTNAQAFRGFTNVNSGKLYVAFKFRNTAGTTTNWSGFSFYNGGTELKFVGESFAADRGFTVGTTVLGTATLLADTDYTILVMHDFSANTTYGNIYTNSSSTIPAVEPGTWQVTDSGAMAAVNRIRLGGNAGMRWDEIRIATNYYELLEIAATDPALFVGPTNISLSLMKGNTSSATFVVTNQGSLSLLYTNTITYGSGSGWLTVAPTGGTVAGVSSRIHTGTVSAVGLAAGSYIATNRVAGNQTNSPVNVIFDVTVTNIPAPTAVTATNDGNELVRMAWTAAGSLQVMIVHRANADISADPTDNTLYNVGDSIGGGTVIFKGTASSREHVVAQGSTNYYRFYSINNNHYSPNVAVAATTGVYKAGERVDQFAYTNAVPLNGVGGGQGFTNTWAATAPNASVDVVVDNADFSAFQPNWPAERANRMVLKTTNSSTYAAQRHFNAVTSGKLYVAALYRREFNEGATDSKFSGISLMDGSNERMFVGEPGGASAAYDDIFAVAMGATRITTGSANSFPAAVDYLIIGRYDFDTGIFSGIYYTNTTAVPAAEPTFLVSVTNSFSKLDGVRLSSGATDGWNGQVFFDELRIATNWSQLLLLDAAPPYATNYIIGNATNHVSDAQVNAGTFPVMMALRADGGVESTNTSGSFFQPNFDLWTPNSVQILTDRVFSTFTYLDSGLTLIASNTTHAGAAPAAIVLGVYTARWSAISSNGFATIDSTTLSNGTAITFTVFDDDTTAPTTMNIQSPESSASRSMHLTSNTVAVGAVGGTSGTNITYRLTDQFLATGLSVANPLIFYFGAADAGSGLARGTTNAATDSSLTIGSAIISNVANWDATLSSAFASTLSSSATNAWRFTNTLSATQIENLVTNATFGFAGSNRVMITWRDADNDRLNDQSTLETQHGWLLVVDDDTTPPTIQNFRIFGAEGSYTVRVDELTSGTGWAITGRVSDASGVNVNGAETNQPNNSPYFELWDFNGALRFRKAFNTLGFTDGGATSLSSVSNGAEVVSGVTFSDVGVWTARVIVADNDEDYGNNDHAIGTNEFTFSVIAGATLGGIGRGPASFAVTSSFGTVTSTNPWPVFFVTNIGSGTLNYNATVSYSGAGGWLTVAPTNGTLTGNGSSRNHTNTIDASGLAPGLYSATITLNGDQTNAAQTITISLRVFGFYPGEIVDQFTNTSGSLNGTVGGTGWINAWSNNPSSGFAFSNTSLTVPGNYPSSLGNKICGDTTSDTELRSFRYFNEFTTGKVFMAVAVRKTDGDANGFNGISFMSNAAEVAFAGKIFNNGNFGIDLAANGGNAVGSFGVNGTGDPGYFYIGMYDFASNRFVGRAYNNSDSLPSTEPSWQVTGTPTVAIGSINGIRVAARNEGTFCFDEIRVATSWEGLLLQFTNEPNVHASGISFRDVTTNSMVVGWTPGNGGNRIVVAREGSAVTFLPTDNSNYAANANFPVGTDLGGGQRVVYNGGGTNFTLTGLTETTRYFFAIFEYNGSPPNYYTNAGYATGDRWTLASEPATNATAFAAHTVSETAISNTWVAAAGTPAPDGYLVVRFTNTIAFLPQDGVGYTNGQVVNGGEVVRVVTPGSATTVLHTNLTACRQYHFRIFSFRWNGSAAETYNYYTNASPTATAETECAEPTIQASNIVFSSIGTNRITLSWDVGNGDARLVVVRGTNEVNAHPVDGTSYTANPNFGSGSHLGGGNYVVFSGTGTTVTVTGLVPAVTYHFRVYEYNGSGSGVDYNTNTAVQNPRSVATIAQGLIYEGFEYGAFVNMSGQSGGTGWTNSWSTSGGLVESGSGNFPDFGAYPPDTPSSTRSGFIDLGNASEDTSGFRALRRHFEPFTSGKFVMALKINDNHSLSSTDYLGVNILNGSAVTAFVGKASGVADRRLSVEHNGQVRTNRIDNTNDGYQLNAGTDYLIVFEYDFNTKRLSARAYVQSQVAHAMPDREAAWIVEMTNVTISKIDGIQIIARDANQIVTFDSIRIGPSWEEVMWALPAGWHTANGPVPSLVYIGTNYGPSVYNMVITNLSDAELVSMNLIDFAIRWDASYGGIFLTNNTATNLNIGSHNARVTPNWDPLAVGAATNEFNLDRFFTNYFGINGSTVVTTYQKAGFNITNLNFDLQYFITVSAEAAPAGAPTVSAPNGPSWAAIPTNRAITINWPLRFYVYDDDTNAPVFGNRPMRVFTNSAIASAQSVGSLERYFVYDGVLTQAGMRLMFNVYDDYSGLQRSSSGPAATNMNITVPFVATNNFADYEAAWSSTNTLASTATSTWSFANSLFTWDRVTAMWGGDGSGSQGQDLEVTITTPDADADRLDDQMAASNTVAGYIRLLDDDEVPPEAQNVVFSGAAARPFFVLTNLFAVGSGDTLIRGNYDRRSGTGSNTVFAVTDEEMAQAGSRSLQFAFGARDVHSGVGRGASGSTNEVMSFSLGAGFMSGVVTGWSAGLSSPATGANVIQTNIWAFSNGTFSETVITQLMAVTGSSGSGSNRVAVTIPDSDNDRLNDQSRATDLTVGWLRVFDDDIKGPSMTALQVDNAYSDEAVLFTSFETSEGWPGFQASGSLWTNILTNGLGTGVWYGTGYVNLNDAAGGNRKAGFTVTGVGQYFEMPARQDVGKVSLDARLSSGTTTRHLELQYWSGTNWASAGTNEVSSPDYAQLVWNVDVPGLTTLRIVRVGTDGTPGIYMDNLLVTQSGFLTDTNAFGWTNLTSVTVRWNHATDDFSGIDEYRQVAPAIGSSAPVLTNNGTGISGSTTSQVVSLLHQQGTITGFIFAIDNDNDRSNDRAMGNVVSYRLRIDTNPPLAVISPTNITDDPLVDETTEVKVQWTPASTNMEIAAGRRVSDSTALSPWDTYIITVHELDGSFNPINTTVITRLNGPANLGSNNTSSIVISNLNFDAFHRIRIAARDKAGNIGPEVVVTGLTVNFQVTQGISRVFSPGTNGVRLAWIASTNRVYDQLFVDSMNLTDTLSNQWNWVDRITNNFAGGNMLVDEGGYNPTNHFRVMPELLGATMRFYRVSLQDAWQPSNVVRRGSREVYVTKPITLVPGENWYSAFFAPDTATVAYVFGTNRVPAGSAYATATRIHWFSPTNIGGSSYNHITNTVVLIGSGSGGTWMHWTGMLGAVMNDWVFPVNQGFMIEMPSGASTVRLPIVGRVVTQQQVIAITGVPTGTNNFHILNWNYPVRVSLTGALFRGSGMVGHNFVTFADEVRILDNTKGLGSLSQPKARWHLRSDQSTWQLVSWSTNYYASAPTLASFRIEPEDVVVIVRRNPGIMNWTNRVYYTPPGKNFNP